MDRNNVVDFLFEELESFMINENWEYENVPEQARSIFTTICILRNCEADTGITDEMLRVLYFRAALEEIVEYDDFIQFMYEQLV